MTVIQSPCPTISGHDLITDHEAFPPTLIYDVMIACFSSQIPKQYGVYSQLLRRRRIAASYRIFVRDVFSETSFTQTVNMSLKYILVHTQKQPLPILESAVVVCDNLGMTGTASVLTLTDDICCEGECENLPRWCD